MLCMRWLVRRQPAAFSSAHPGGQPQLCSHPIRACPASSPQPRSPTPPRPPGPARTRLKHQRLVAEVVLALLGGGGRLLLHYRSSLLALACARPQARLRASVGRQDGRARLPWGRAAAVCIERRQQLEAPRSAPYGVSPLAFFRAASRASNSSSSSAAGAGRRQCSYAQPCTQAAGGRRQAERRQRQAAPPARAAARGPASGTPAARTIASSRAARGAAWKGATRRPAPRTLPRTGAPRRARVQTACMLRRAAGEAALAQVGV